MDINTATRQQLEEVGQIDGDRAQYLIDHRERNGRFGSWEDVKRVPSYEDGMVERLQRAGFSVGGGGTRADARGDADRSRSAGGSASHSLNRASADELEQTHMIDGERARRLVNHREQRGRFSSWEDVKSVSGFDDGLIERLREEGFELT